MKIKRIITSIIVVAFFASCDKLDENEFPEVLSSQSEVISFVASSVDGDFFAKVDTSAKTITGILPPYFNITDVTPDITLSRGATLVPENGISQDFSSSFLYEITSRSTESETKYNVDLYVAGMVSFTIEDYQFDINYNNNSIVKIFEPEENPINDYSSVIPNIVISEGSTISPAIGEAVDLRVPVVYTLTTPRGDIIKYTISISVIASVDYFENFDNNWTTAGTCVWETDDVSGILKMQNDWGWANGNGAYKNEVDLQGDFEVELKVKFKTSEDVWPATGFFIGGNLDGINPAFAFAIRAHDLNGSKTNHVGIHGINGWLEADIVVDGIDTFDWTILRIEKHGDEIKSYVNDELVSTLTVANVNGKLGLFGERMSAEYEYIKFKQL